MPSSLQPRSPRLYNVDLCHIPLFTLLLVCSAQPLPPSSTHLECLLHFLASTQIYPSRLGSSVSAPELLKIMLVFLKHTSFWKLRTPHLILHFSVYSFTVLFVYISLITRIAGHIISVSSMLPSLVLISWIDHWYMGFDGFHLYFTKPAQIMTHSEGQKRYTERICRSKHCTTRSSEKFLE